MSSAEAAWTRLHALAEQARQAAATRQQLEIRLSPDESTVLARVLEAALYMTTTMANKPESDLSGPSDDELAYLAMQGGAFDWLADEPDLYSDDHLQERFEWATA